MYLQGGKGQYKIVVYTQALQDPQGLHLEVAELLDKRHYLCACYELLENGFGQWGITTNDSCESTNNPSLSEIHQQIFDLCCEMNTYISQQFPHRRVKCLFAMEECSDFSLGQHTFTLQLARN